jgi:hypothetical protein
MQFSQIVNQSSRSGAPATSSLPGGASSIEAINLGVAASNFPEYLPILRDAVALLRPKAIFLVVWPNDLPAKPITAELLAPAGEFPRLNPFVPRVLAVLNRLSRGLVVPRRTPTGPFPFFEPVPAPSNPFSLRLRDYVSQNLDPAIFDAMKRGKANPFNIELGTLYEHVLRHDFRKFGGGAENYLEQCAKLCNDGRCRFVVAYLPHSCTASPAYIPAANKLGGSGFGDLKRVDQPPYRNQQDHLREVCGQLGIPFLDMTDDFIAAEKSGQRLYWPYDGHCTAAGYRLAAEICAHYWLTGALPQRASGE